MRLAPVRTRGAGRTRAAPPPVAFSPPPTGPDPMHDALTVTTPPASEPVTAAELAAHLKLNTGTAEYDALTGFIKAARELFERHTGRILLPTVFRQSLTELSAAVELLRAPVA